MRTLIAVLGAVAVFATSAIPSATPASAGDRYYRDYGDRGWNHHRSNSGDALAAGVIGLGVGALIGGALADSGRRPVYDDDYPRYRSYGVQSYQTYRGDYYGGPILEGPVYQHRVLRVERPIVYREIPVYSSGYGHVAACEARYRSYDRRTDTFVGYDGRVHRCMLR